jgi:hypothetical protein
MERRREVLKRVLKRLWVYCMKSANIPDPGVNVIFPEIITQDRSAKLKDLLLCEQSRWLKPERVATMAAKEMGVSDYSYQEELEDLKEQLPEVPLVLGSPEQADPPQSMDPQLNSPKQPPAPGESEGGEPEVSGLPGTERNEIKNNDSNL